MKTGNKGKLVFKEKTPMKMGLVRDGVIWWIGRSDQYPDGFRYRLALIEVESRSIVILFDNHSPKGHHYHLEDGTEVPYHFESVEKLMSDYLKAADEEKRKREDKKNPDSTPN